jgi:hypothetical protein
MESNIVRSEDMNAILGWTASKAEDWRIIETMLQNQRKPPATCVGGKDRQNGPEPN